MYVLMNLIRYHRKYFDILTFDRMKYLWKLRFLMIGLIIMTYYVILLNSYHFISSQNLEKKYEKKHETIQNIVNLLSRLNQALKFFEKNISNVNLDGLFGLRITQG